MKRRIATIIIILMPISALVYSCRGVYFFLDIPPHIGDGEFQNVSRRDGPLVINGYRIISEPIELSKNYKRKMTMSRLPEIGVNCMLFFVIDDPDERLQPGGDDRHRLVHGEVTLELCDS